MSETFHNTAGLSRGIKDYVKKHFPTFKFSVRKKSGYEVCVTLISGTNIFKTSNKHIILDKYTVHKNEDITEVGISMIQDILKHFDDDGFFISAHQKKHI